MPFVQTINNACHIEATPEAKQQKTLGFVPVPLPSSFHKKHIYI
jgi:hypothetical protein